VIRRHQRHGWALHVRVTVYFTATSGVTKTAVHTLRVFAAATPGPN
jgi:hypothetical protein